MSSIVSRESVIRAIRRVQAYDNDEYNAFHICDDCLSKSHFASDIVNKVILYFDIDTFHVQLLQRGADLSKPFVVVDSSHRIIALTKSAKKMGFARLDRLHHSWFNASNLTVLHIPDRYSKPDFSSARILQFQFHKILEKHGLKVGTLEIEGDGGWIELYPTNATCCRYTTWKYLQDDRVVLETVEQKVNKNNYTFGLAQRYEYDENVGKLLSASSMAIDIMDEAKETLGLVTSCGISTNKSMAKLAAGLNRPGKITVLPFNALQGRVNKQVRISGVPGLGKTLVGELKQAYNNVHLTLYDLGLISLNNLIKHLGMEKAIKAKLASAGYNYLRQVVEKLMSKGVTSTNKPNPPTNNFRASRDQITIACLDFIDRMQYEEEVYHNRTAIEAKIEIISKWSNHRGIQTRTYSYIFQMQDDFYYDTSGHEMTNECLHGLRSAGFNFNRHYVTQINLSVAKFSDNEPEHKPGAVVHCLFTMTTRTQPHVSCFIDDDSDASDSDE